jgi:hypothetical protein
VATCSAASTSSGCTATRLGWQSEVESWAREHGEERVVFWETYRPNPMSAALERFVTDLTTAALSHDGCPLTGRTSATR